MNSSSLCRVNVGMFYRRLFPNQRALTAGRYLYTDQFLGIDKYAEVRDTNSKKLAHMKDNFISRMKQQLNSSSQTMMFTEDLKTVLHVADDKPEDLEICVEMIKRFHKQNSELRFGTFVFGPVVMRLLYYLKKPAIILELMQDKELGGFFDQIKTHILSMDILYKHGLYQEVIDLNKQLMNKSFIETKYPKETVVLTMASCYKLNTPESYQYATEFFTKAREAGADVNRKAMHFVIALALNQNRGDVALEIISSIVRNNGIAGNNLKLLALAQLDRLQDAFNMLQRVGDQDYPAETRVLGQICRSTLEELQKSVDRVNDTEKSHTFDQLARSLRESNSISDQSIDEILCNPIEYRPFFRDSQGMFNDGQRNMPQNRFGYRDEPRFERRENPGRRSFAGVNEDFY